LGKRPATGQRERLAQRDRPATVSCPNARRMRLHDRTRSTRELLQLHLLLHLQLHLLLHLLLHVLLHVLLHLQLHVLVHLLDPSCTGCGARATGNALSYWKRRGNRSCRANSGKRAVRWKQGAQYRSLPTCMPACVPKCVPKCMPKYMLKCVPKCMPKCMPRHTACK
jgi:hypothetical protein